MKLLKFLLRSSPDYWVAFVNHGLGFGVENVAQILEQERALLVAVPFLQAQEQRAVEDLFGIYGPYGLVGAVA